MHIVLVEVIYKWGTASTVGGGTGYVKNITFEDFFGKWFDFLDADQRLIPPASLQCGQSDPDRPMLFHRGCCLRRVPKQSHHL